MSPKATGDNTHTYTHTHTHTHYQAKYFTGLELIPQKSNKVNSKDRPVMRLCKNEQTRPVELNFSYTKYASTNNFQGKIKNLKKN